MTFFSGDPKIFDDFITENVKDSADMLLTYEDGEIKERVKAGLW